jgi:ankyrin repeat protein
MTSISGTCGSCDKSEAGYSGEIETDDNDQLHQIEMIVAMAKTTGHLDSPTQGDSGNTMLHLACIQGYVSMAEGFLRAGANPEVRNNHGKSTPLMCACQNGHVKCANLLLKYGANVDGPTVTGCTPLFVVSLHNHIEIVKLLVKSNAQIDNVVEFDGMSPLLIATAKGHHEIVNILLNYGANPYLRNKENINAFQMSRYRPEVKVLLMEWKKQHGDEDGDDDDDDDDDNDNNNNDTDTDDDNLEDLVLAAVAKRIQAELQGPNRDAVMEMLRNL